MDFSPWRWMRDFVILGAGIGLLAPSVLLGPIAWGGGVQPVIAALFLGCSVLGAFLGVGVGVSLAGISALMRDHPIATFWMGFPVGAFAGLVVGTIVGSFLGNEGTIVGPLGMITGGLVLGFVWMPYLALRLRGRSGLPVVLAGVFSSPIMGLMAIFGVMGFSMMTGTNTF